MFWSKTNKLKTTLTIREATILKIKELVKEPYSDINFLTKQQLEVELSDIDILLKKQLPDYYIPDVVVCYLPFTGLHKVLLQLQYLQLVSSSNKPTTTPHEFCKEVFNKCIHKYWTLPHITEEWFINTLIDKYNEVSHRLHLEAHSSTYVDFFYGGAYSGIDGLRGYYKPYNEGDLHEFSGNSD